jgi:hypothetical protein
MINKNTVLLVAFAFISTTNVYAARGHSGASDAEALVPRTDVLSIGPDGKRLFYFCDGSDVFIRNCENDKAVNTREDCQGLDGKPARERRISRATFEEALKTRVTIDQADFMKPLEKADVEAFNNNKTFDAIELAARRVRIKEEFDQAEAFLKEMGLDATDAQKAKYNKLQNEWNAVEREIENSKNQLAAIDKVNKQIGEVVKNVCDNSKIHKVRQSSDKHKLIFSVLSQFDPSAYPCGHKGSLADRVAACDTVKKTGGGTDFALVSREISNDGKNKEYWQDKSRNGGDLVWGPVANEKMNLEQAKQYCEGLSDLGMKWTLPTKDDYLKAADNSSAEQNRGFAGHNVVLLDIVPDWGRRYFLAASVYPHGSGVAFFFNGNSGEVGVKTPSLSDGFVRCVSRAGR